MALVGIVLLMGIVKKNAIMMVDFAIEAERTRAITPQAAIHEACLLRFRPIMMTTMAALLGALPLVLGRGAGSELRWPLGVTIIGGLLLQPVPYAVHHAGDLSGVRAAADAFLARQCADGAGGMTLLPVMAAPDPSIRAPATVRGWTGQARP